MYVQCSAKVQFQGCVNSQSGQRRGHATMESDFSEPCTRVPNIQWTKAFFCLFPTLKAMEQPNGRRNRQKIRKTGAGGHLREYFCTCNVDAYASVRQPKREMCTETRLIQYDFPPTVTGRTPSQLRRRVALPRQQQHWATLSRIHDPRFTFFPVNKMRMSFGFSLVFSQYFTVFGAFRNVRLGY